MGNVEGGGLTVSVMYRVRNRDIRERCRNISRMLEGMDQTWFGCMDEGRLTK